MKPAEQRLHESEARLQAAVDLVQMACYSWNPQTNELHWDATLRAMWGLPRELPESYEVWRAGIHPDDLPRIDAAIERCVNPAGDGIYDIEHRVIRRNDGAERWVATRGKTLFEDRKPVSFYGVAIDVTDRKRIESRLEDLVTARTRELDAVNQQLRSQIEQREIAEAAVHQLRRLDALGQITSGVAHDFNNLLSIILINTHLLLRKQRDPDDQEGLELIQSAATRGAKLTSQLLAFARQQRLKPQPVDLNNKVMGMTELLRATLGDRVHLNTTLDPHLPAALTDPTQLEMIILNLTINGRDAMKSGGTLDIATFPAVIEASPSRPEEPPAGDYVGIAVKDTGFGIPAEVLPRVFDPFFTTKDWGEGSGLGLAQVFGFAKQSGGGVRIQTRIGEGTSVTVYMPRADAEEGEDDEAPADTGKDQQAGRPHILIVDDDAAVLKSTVRLLGSDGYAAIPAQSGAAALRLIASNVDVDVVLTDFAMPEMSGLELARAIHASRPALPVVICTAYVDDKVLRGFDQRRILQKPYTHGELVAKLTAAMHQG